MPPDLSDEERKAIAAFKRLANRWPSSLWLFAGGQDGVCVLKAGPDGEHVHKSDGGIDPEFVVAQIDISADGGDW